VRFCEWCVAVAPKLPNRQKIKEKEKGKERKKKET
jgi:hypothetical protein